MTLPQGSEKPAAAGQPEPDAPAQTPAEQAFAGQQAVAGQPAVSAEPGTPGPRGAPAQHVVKRTRVGGVWVASGLFALVLLLLLIFILENGGKVKITFFGASGHLPLGVALLLAAVLGVLLVVLPGSARIIQLRRTARRHRKLDAKAAAVPPAGQGPAAGGAGTS